MASTKYKTLEDEDSHYNWDYHAPLEFDGYSGKVNYSYITNHIRNFVADEAVISLVQKAIANKVDHSNYATEEDIVLIDPFEHDEVNEYSPDVVYIVASIDYEHIHLFPFEVWDDLGNGDISQKVADLYSLSISLECTNTLVSIECIMEEEEIRQKVIEDMYGVIKELVTA